MKRRSVLAAGAALLASACVSRLGSPFSAGAGRPRISVPPLACDSHIHILDPAFPARPGWPGSPVDEAGVAVYRAFQQRIGTERAVVVQPSTYGTDNSATIDALRQFGGMAKGVAVIDCDAPPTDLTAMKHAGVEGLRVNFVSPQTWGRTDLRRLTDTAKIAANMDWHIQVFARGADILAMKDVLADLPTPLVIDHLGHVSHEKRAREDEVAAICALLGNGKTWLKLSGAYIASSDGAPAYGDLFGVARAYIAAAPEQLIWGSDWPHRGQGANPPDDAALIDLLLDWVTDATQRHAILVDNPAKLYRFS